MKWALRVVVGAATLVAVLSSLFTLIEIPSSWQASIAYVNTANLIQRDPKAAMVADMIAVAAFPFESYPRRELYTMVGELAHRGEDVGEEMSERIYKISSAAGGNAANLLTARLYWIIFTGRSATSHNAEAKDIIGRLKIAVPSLRGLDEAAAIVQ